MKAWRWSEEKNRHLKAERGVSFEEVLLAISEAGLLDILEHNNPKKYPSQKILVIAIEAYAYLIPFVETASEIFLKTIIPSRKATKKYIIDKTNK